MVATHQEKRDKTFWTILNSALELDFKKGHLKWTMSDLSRKSGITRSLVYYYFGRSKISILLEAVRVVGEEVIGIQPHRIEWMRQGEWARSMNETRRVIDQAPFLCSFYMNHRDREGEIGDLLRKMEISYMQKLRALFTGASTSELAAIYAVFFGAIFSPMPADGSQQVVADLLQKVFGSKLSPEFARR